MGDGMMAVKLTVEPGSGRHHSETVVKLEGEVIRTFLGHPAETMPKARAYAEGVRDTFGGLARAMARKD